MFQLIEAGHVYIMRGNPVLENARKGLLAQWYRVSLALRRFGVRFAGSPIFAYFQREFFLFDRRIVGCIRCSGLDYNTLCTALYSRYFASLLS